jgi:hypothetical protein
MNHKQMNTSNPSVYGANNTTDLCTTFCNRAILTWQYLRNGVRSGIELGEETLTDINLLDIQLRHPNEVRTAKFNRIKEGRETGADWEWWFGSKSGWLGLRIQAKKLNHTSLEYDSLDKASKKHGYQVDMLLADAMKNGLVPLYCLYNFWDTHRSAVQWNCGTYAQSSELHGCTLANANDIKSLISANDKSLKSVSAKALPWNCLVCCQGFSNQGDDITRRASGILRGFWNFNDNQMRIAERPPDYVSNVLAGEFSRETPMEISHLMIVTEGLL